MFLTSLESKNDSLAMCQESGAAVKVCASARREALSCIRSSRLHFRMLMNAGTETLTSNYRLGRIVEGRSLLYFCLRKVKVALRYPPIGQAPATN